MLNEVTDIKIWNQLRNGDPQSLLNLYNGHYIGLINFGTRMTGDRELTNDCISQVLIKLWNKHKNLPEVENVRAYLVTCLKNELLIELNKVNKTKFSNNDLKNELIGQEMSYEEYLIQTQTNVEIKDNLIRSFSCLSKREKQLLQMKFFDDLSYEDIALKCNITRRTAYNIIHTALKTLKADFRKTNTPILSYNNLVPVSLIVIALCDYLIQH